MSNVTVGRMRMQFWKDAIEKTYAGRPPAEPVAVLLDKVLREDGAPLSKGFFRKVISSRVCVRPYVPGRIFFPDTEDLCVSQEQYLGNVPFPTLSALESYAENTYSSLSYLALESFHQHSVTLDHIASHIGKSTGITAILRGMPLLASPLGGPGAGAVVFPLDVCAEFDLRQEDILRQGSKAPGLGDAVFKVATLANDHLITARKMLADSGAEGQGIAFASFLPAVCKSNLSWRLCSSKLTFLQVPTSLYLERLEAVDFDPFHRSLQKMAWKLPWRAYRAYSTKKL